MITPNTVSVQEKNNQTVNDAFPKRCSVKKDRFCSLFTFAVNLKRTNPQQVRVVLFRRFFETLLRKKKTAFAVFFFWQEQ